MTGSLQGLGRHKWTLYCIEYNNNDLNETGSTYCTKEATDNSWSSSLQAATTKVTEPLKLARNLQYVALEKKTVVADLQRTYSLIGCCTNEQTKVLAVLLCYYKSPLVISQIQPRR
jgi:hypothetical protein